MGEQTFQARVRENLLGLLANPWDDEIGQLNDALRYLSKWRSALLQNTYIARHGTAVLQGPFAGMEINRNAAEGCHVPKLVGCYEQPLHPHFEQAIATGYDTVVNIGCAEGYYAVGMARRMPKARILARDIDEKALEACRELAERNGVAERIEVAGLFTPGDFAQVGPGRVLVLCDIEGGEQALLDPDAAPALRGMDLIVECHEGDIKGITRTIAERFKPSHQIELIEDDGQRTLEPMPPWFNNLANLDQLLAAWEWRSGPTPWLVMKAINPST